MSHSIENSAPLLHQPVPQPRNGLGDIALAFGIAGIVLSLIPDIGVIAWPLVILGVIFGVLGILAARNDTANNEGVAIIGTVLSVIGLAFCFAWGTAFAALMSNPPPPPASVPAVEVPTIVPPAAPDPTDSIKQSVYDQVRAYGIEGTDEQLTAMACDLRKADSDPHKIYHLGQVHGLNQTDASYVAGLAVGFPCGN